MASGLYKDCDQVELDSCKLQTVYLTVWFLFFLAQDAACSGIKVVPVPTQVLVTADIDIAASVIS